MHTGSLEAEDLLHNFRRWLLEEYHKARGRKRVSPRVASDYVLDIKMLLRENVLVLTDLERSVSRALEYIAERYPNPNSRTVPQRALKAFLRFMGRPDLAELVTVERGGRRSNDHPLGREEVEALLEEAGTLELAAFIAVMATGGARPKTLWGIHWGMLRFEAWGGYAEPRHYDPYKPGYIVVFNARARRLLEELRDTRRPIVFSQTTVRRKWREAVRRLWDRGMLRRYGDPRNVGPYLLRKYFINQAYRLWGAKYRELIKFLIGEKPEGLRGDQVLDTNYLYYKHWALEDYPRIADKLL